MGCEIVSKKIAMIYKNNKHFQSNKYFQHFEINENLGCTFGKLCPEQDGLGLCYVDGMKKCLLLLVVVD